MSGVSLRSPLGYTIPSHVTLKVLHCVLFIFFNRAHRVLRISSTVVDSLDITGTAMLPLFISCALHAAFLCPGLVSATRSGRVPVVYAILHVLMIHTVALLLITTALHRYPTTANFLSVLLASHMCVSVRPWSVYLVPVQSTSYGMIMPCMAYVIPVLSWILLPILRIHELEAVALLYIPEAMCFIFAYALQFTTLLVHLAVVAGCSVCGFGSHPRDGKHD
jgi:hypothetical protein